MTEYGLLGRSLGHSFSADFFNRKFQKEGIAAKYTNFELPDISGLPALISEHTDLRGLNVTIPYKRDIIPYLDELDDASRIIGAVNTVKISKEANGTIHMSGYNTDAPGFLVGLDSCNFPTPRRALILGTGGASAAVHYALRSRGVECKFVSRRSHEGEDFITYNELDKEIIAVHRLIVNCTPLGTAPDVDSRPDIPYQFITPEHLAYDLVYNPGFTSFMSECAKRGAKVRNGLAMLHAQALKSYSIWTNAKQD